ncbi:hypothetical protein [Candidatus Poriferisocius sp.]|uniref:hypothetical protein n=1 Tax=Candidatus Poriferisocius sp. TaxID=3101276 RepID=UPI003B01A5D8
MRTLTCKLYAISLGAVCEVQVLKGPKEIISTDKDSHHYDQPKRQNRFLNSIKWRDSYTLAPKKVEQEKEFEDSDYLRFSLEEYVDLSDGQRIILRKGRGWSGWSESDASSKWMYVSGQELTKKVMLVLEPDDYDIWIEWVAEQLNKMGVAIETASLRSVPYTVEFGPSVQHKLQELRPLT